MGFGLYLNNYDKKKIVMWVFCLWDLGDFSLICCKIHHLSNLQLNSSGGLSTLSFLQKVTLRSWVWQEFQSKSAITPGNEALIPWIPALWQSPRGKEHSQSDHKLCLLSLLCSSSAFISTHHKICLCKTKWSCDSALSPVLTAIHKEQNPSIASYTLQQNLEVFRM